LPLRAVWNKHAHLRTYMPPKISRITKMFAQLQSNLAPFVQSLVMSEPAQDLPV